MMNAIQPAEPAPIVGFLDAPDKEKRLHQMELERLYNKNQTLHRIRSEFKNCQEFDFEKYFRFKEIPEEFGYDLLVQMALHKRTTLPTLVGILRRHFEPDADACQQAADMLQRAAQADLVDWHQGLSLFIVKITISDDVQADLDRFQYPLPMVVPPRSVRDNRDTGYFTSRGSIILRKNHHDDDVCLDHINRVNKVRFSINYDTAYMIKNQWRNLDRPKAGESTDEFKKRVKAFEKYDRTAKQVIDHLLRYGNEFYLTHRYDKRGRIYCQGYHVNYQGAPWNKAVIELADKEFVN
jgi:hypothetical protein